MNNHDGWVEYLELCKPYCEKYDIQYFIDNSFNLKKFNQIDLRNFYKGMRKIVLKHYKNEII
jgi:hypothetical protein